MEFKIDRLAGDEWRVLLKDAHGLVFEKIKEPVTDRSDGCLLVINKDTNQPIGYISYFEFDKGSIYWQWGGLFPKFRNNGLVGKIFRACIDIAKEDYKFIHFMVHRDNISMLKLAFMGGFRINGIRIFKKDDIYCEMTCDLERESESICSDIL